jgi:hypothetical protein
LARQQKGIRALGDERVSATGSERTSAAQEKNRFQKAGFTGAVRAHEQIRPRVQRQLDARQTSKPLGAETAEGHRRTPYKRIGITT